MGRAEHGPVRESRSEWKYGGRFSALPLPSLQQAEIYAIIKPFQGFQHSCRAQFLAVRLPRRGIEEVAERRLIVLIQMPHQPLDRRPVQLIEWDGLPIPVDERMPRGVEGLLLTVGNVIRSECPVIPLGEVVAIVPLLLVVVNSRRL